MPTEPVSPKPIARPCTAAASVTSRAVSPVSAQAVRRSGSISIAFMSRRSITIPPSVDAMAEAAVAAAADGELHAGLARERDDVLDVGGVGHPDDARPAGDRSRRP